MPLLQLPGLLILTRFSNLSTGSRYRSASNTKLFLPLLNKVLQSSSPHYLRDIITIQPSRSSRSSSLVTLLHPQARQSSLKITNRSFRYAAPHIWNKLPPSLCVSCQLATSQCSPPSPGRDSAPKSVVGVSHRVFHSRLKTHFFSPDPFPRNLPLSLTD